MIGANGTTDRQMTEAEKERADRARIDRLNELKKAYADRGNHPSTFKIEEVAPELAKVMPVPPPEMKPSPPQPAVSRPVGSKSQTILDACKKLALPNGDVMRDKLLVELGSTTRTETNRIASAISQLKAKGRFPYQIIGPGTKVKKPRPKPDLSCLDKPKLELTVTNCKISNSSVSTTTGSLDVPSYCPPEIAAQIEIGGFPTFADVIADLDRIFDETLKQDDREFAIRYLRRRFGAK